MGWTRGRCTRRSRLRWRGGARMDAIMILALLTLLLVNLVD